MNLCHYVIVRKDLPLGVIVAQTIHAAGESASKWAQKQAQATAEKSRPDVEDDVLDMMDVMVGWSSTKLELPEGTHAVALAADDENHLLKISERLARDGVDHHVIREPDEPWLGSAMAIGVVPCARDQVKRALSSVRLLR